MDNVAPEYTDVKEGVGRSSLHSCSDDRGTERASCFFTAVDDESKSFHFDEELPFPTRSYSCNGGDFLHLFRPPDQSGTSPIHCYSPWTVRGDDVCSLVAYFEVEDEEKEFTLGVCGDTEKIVGTFLQYFASGQTMHPIGRQGVRRCCICPWHRRAVILASLDDRVISCIQLPSAEFCRLRNKRGRGEGEVKEDEKQRMVSRESDTSPTDVDVWRLVVEHKGRGFVRFFGVERRKGSCYCDAPLSQLS